MRILAIDTSGTSCSVAILSERRLAAEVTSEKKQTHSRHLMSLIHTVFKMAGMPCGDVDLLAVVNGPGSFTGIRIGVSTVQGLAMALGKPVLSVSSLEALAVQAGPLQIVICPILDARKGEVYMALYRYENDLLTQIQADRVIEPLRLMDQIEEPCFFIGSGAQIHGRVIRQRLGGKAILAGQRRSKIRAETVARIALQKSEDRPLQKVNPLIPHYVRKSDAEIQAGKKR